MSQAEVPVMTDIERVEAKVDLLLDKHDALIEAVNGLGTNMQWVIDNAKNVFQMFSNPQFMAQLPTMMGGNPSGE